MVFAKTIADARNLKTIFTHVLPQEVCPCLLVGRTLMDWKTEQKVVLEGFRRGDSRLLVCTSVLEEGIDVTDCNIVVRLDG